MRPAAFLARGLAYGLCVTYRVIGTAVLLLLAIGGLWQGFARATYILFFLAVAAYVYGTAYIAYRFARVPRIRSGALLLILVAPALLYLASGAGDSRGLSQEAEIYARNDNAQEVDEARQVLLAQGRRAGRKNYVEVLLHHLEAADSDSQRIRLVCMLGELSYQHDGVLVLLRHLEAATRDEPERERLRHAVERALLQVNPYERGQPSQPGLVPEASADACGPDREQAASQP